MTPRNGPPDVVVVGSGPNGLAAATTMARAGLSVDVYETAPDAGGGLRSKALFRDDVVHDVCAAVHPMAGASRFFREFDLPARGVELLAPEISYAHPLPTGRAALAYRSLAATCAALGADGRRWHALMAPLVTHSRSVVDLLLSEQRRLPRDPAAPLLLLRRVLAHGTALTAPRQFAGEEAAALLTGVAAHVIGPVPTPTSAAVALLLGHLAHADTGWPVVRGGSARIADALVADLTAHGGRVFTGQRVTDIRDVRRARAVLLDVGPKEFLAVAGAVLPPGYRRRLRSFRYGPGAAKVDFLVSDPVPWTDPAVGRAGTVHLGGARRDVVRSEGLVSRGTSADRPFVLVVDPTAADPGRARGGFRPLWAYAHVPNGDPADPVHLVTEQLERYAPGFADTVVAARGTSAAELEEYNANYVGGDIAGGAMGLRQALARPTLRLDPYTTPLRRVYLCSSSTPPGPGVHGMSGYQAALSALKREFGIRSAPLLKPRTG
ncbi:NAD(P)/FAD-dependent oxidoreductase [Streptomyces sp. NPDC047315]|uniref:phytoene desaturase family protein n=1 Tax=Streptomyces sp. NPDC047315 TaxID=3155142 RepID=UPI0033DD439C